MQINKKVLIIAIILGLITAGLIYSYMSTVDEQVVIPVEETEIVVAIDTIPAYVQITEDMLEIVSIPSSAVHPQAFLSKEAVVGGVTKTEIIQGEQILSSRVVTDVANASLAYRIPETMRAITIPTSEMTGVAGHIDIGNHIDILVYYTGEEVNSQKLIYTQFQNVEILETGYKRNPTAEGEGDSNPISLTILVTPEEAEVIAYALENGSLRYTLRNPADTEEVDLEQFGIENFDTWRDR